jgi:nuclear pore complex protein Nup205
LELTDNWVVHYFPAIAAYISVYGAQDGMGTLREARMLNKKILGYREHDPWALRYVYAAVCAWWLAEYSGWYLDNPVGSPLVDINLEEGKSLSLLYFLAFRFPEGLHPSHAN